MNYCHRGVVSQVKLQVHHLSISFICNSSVCCSSKHLTTLKIDNYKIYRKICFRDVLSLVDLISPLIMELMAYTFRIQQFSLHAVLPINLCFLRTPGIVGTLTSDFYYVIFYGEYLCWIILIVNLGSRFTIETTHFINLHVAMSILILLSWDDHTNFGKYHFRGSGSILHRKEKGLNSLFLDSDTKYLTASRI